MDKLSGFPPIPPAGKTAEEALAMLAGAVGAALTILLAENPNGVASIDTMILFVAYRQYLDSGFMQTEADAITQGILNSNEVAKGKQ